MKKVIAEKIHELGKESKMIGEDTIAAILHSVANHIECNQEHTFSKFFAQEFQKNIDELRGHLSEGKDD